MSNDLNLPGLANAALEPVGSGSMAASERERAEIQGAIISAKKFPRDEAVAYTKILKAVERPSLAESSTYSFPRGGTKVTGPSVTLAREVARCWGNIGSGFQVVEETAESIHLRGVAIDYETNARAFLEDKFKRLVQRKVGGVTKWVSPDERDLRELINKRGALLERNCILKLIPADIIDRALEEAKLTLDKRDKSSLKENKEDTIRNLVRSYDKIGVTKVQIEEWLGHPVEQITALQLADLRDIRNSIAEGNSKVTEYFKPKKEESSLPTLGKDASA